MRIDELRLTRYGHFTDFSLKLESGPSATDFHVIYGANEAGKSTIRDAFIDLLYGISPQTDYNFLHANDALQIGALMTVAGEAYDYTRIRKNTASLLGADGDVIPESELRAALGDITRESYCNMFSLDEDTLQEGGEGILKSEGDLGELLFSAASGLSGLSAALDALRAEGEAIFKPRGRTHRLAVAKKELKDLEAEIRARDVQAHAYDALVKDERAKRDLYEKAKAARDEDAKRAAHLKAVLDCLEPRRQRNERLAQLEAVEDAPSLPEGWLDEAEALARNDAAVQSSLKDAKRMRARLEDVLKTIPTDDAVLAQKDAIARLTDEDLEARFRAAKDIEKLERSRRGAQDDIGRKLKQLGRSNDEDPSSLIISAAVLGRINELAGLQGGVETAASTAREEHDRAARLVDKRKHALEAFDDDDDLSALDQQFDALSKEFDSRDVQEAENVVARLGRDVDAALSNLVPWLGDARALLAVNAPPRVRVDALKAAEKSLLDDRTALERDIDRIKDEKAEIDAEVKATRDSGAVIDDETAAAARDARDTAWDRHAMLLNGEGPIAADDLQATAGAFHEAMMKDDRIGATRFGQVSAIETLRKAKADGEKRQSALDRAEEKSRALDQRVETLADEISAVMTGLGLPAETPASFLDGWIDRVDEAQGRAKELSDAEEARDVLIAKRDAAQASLVEAMKTAGLAPDASNWDPLAAQCEAALAQWRTKAAGKAEAERQRDDAATDEEERKVKLDRAENALQAWQAEWKAALQTCWIGKAQENASPAQVSEILRVLQDLSGLADKANEYDARIEAMKLDQRRYLEAVQTIAEAVGEAFTADDPLLSADALRGRLAAAQENARRRRERMAELKDVEEREQTAQDESGAIETRFEEMAGVFPANDLGELIDVMKDAELKARLEDEIADLERRILDLLGQSDIDRACALLDAEIGAPEQIDEVRAEHQRLTAEMETANAHVADLFHERKTAEKALADIGGDATVAVLEERKRALLLAIESDAESFLRRSIGAMVVERALNAYRDVHRSSMMERASEAFSTITRGAFTGLSAAPGKGNEVLVGLRARGGSIVAKDMSRGTRFQLYLALRIAGFAEFAQKRDALPFFADDIMEPFDDDRSAETFSLLAEMSKSGQVIYLTHHRHLCGIAQSVCGGGVSIHELPDPALAEVPAESTSA